uniref:Uncharacterized protein n=1 Tax=Knipowitschia caucasica TaxID=637954 RepID=A0AAV2J943_KNICA
MDFIWLYSISDIKKDKYIYLRKDSTANESGSTRVSPDDTDPRVSTIDCKHMQCKQLCMSLRMQLCMSLRMQLCMSLRMQLCMSLHMQLCMSLRMQLCMSQRMQLCMSQRMQLCMSQRMQLCMSQPSGGEFRLKNEHVR